MIVEIMYKEFISYGEKETTVYLEKLFPEADFVYTSYKDKPYFVDNRPDLIFFGPMPESEMEKVVAKLEPYRDRIKELVEDEVVFIILNNALDMFGQAIEVKNGPEAKSLGIFDYKTVRDFDKRHSQLLIADFEGQAIIGNVLGFSSYYGNEDNYLYQAIHPKVGFNLDTPLGGYRYKNAFLSELAGGILLINPYLTKKLRKHFMGDENIPFEKEIRYIYDQNLEKLQVNPDFAKALRAHPTFERISNGKRT